MFKKKCPENMFRNKCFETRCYEVNFCPFCGGEIDNEEEEESDDYE